MKKVTIFCTLIILLVMATPSFASPPNEVTIIVYMPPFGDPSPAEFEASGPAVDADLICPLGIALDDNAHPIMKKDGLIWHSLRRFECEDGSGTFTIRLIANVIFDPYSNKGNWNVLSGTDSYLKLHGSGKLTAYFGTTGDIVDVFTGKVHID